MQLLVYVTDATVYCVLPQCKLTALRKDNLFYNNAENSQKYSLTNDDPIKYTNQNTSKVSISNVNFQKHSVCQTSNDGKPC